MRPFFTKAVRSLKSRGKWHLIGFGSYDTICGILIGGDWANVERSSLDPRDVCANCLRDTP